MKPEQIQAAFDDGLVEIVITGAVKQADSTRIDCATGPRAPSAVPSTEGLVGAAHLSRLEHLPGPGVALEASGKSCTRGTSSNASSSTRFHTGRSPSGDRSTGMASGLIINPLRSRGPDTDVRLRLKPAAPRSGHVDGSWWPRSRDLAAELPTLLAAVTDRLGSTERVSYHLGDWEPAGRSVDVGGAFAVRLSGFRYQAPNTIDVLGPQKRITLLVIPSETSPQTADDALAAAAQPDNTDTVDALLRRPVNRN
jgi:Family of unknown function (DUF5994)